MDIKGLLRLPNALTRVEERLSRYDRPLSLSSSLSNQIPDHNSRTVIMWHFGSDSSNGYAGERSESTWEDGENALIRICTKDLKDGKGIRIRTNLFNDFSKTSVCVTKMFHIICIQV